MKKILLSLVAGITMTSLALAHGGNSGSFGYNCGGPGYQRGGMMGGGYHHGGIGGPGYGYMHNYNVQPENLENGISLTFSGLSDQDLSEAKKVLENNKKQIVSYYPGSEVKIDSVEGKLIVAIVSENKGEVDQLQWDRGMIIFHTLNHGDARMGYGSRWHMNRRGFNPGQNNSQQ